MPDAEDLLSRARMFGDRAEQAQDSGARRHCYEMAAHYRMLAMEHKKARAHEMTR